MNAENLDLRLLRFRSRRDESPHALATSLIEAGRSAEALEVVQIALVDAEDDARLLVLEGRAWFDQGDLAQAQAALLRAAKASPRDKEPYRWLAQVLMKRGEPARAVQVLERALALDGSDKALQQAHMRAQRLARIASEADSDAPGPNAAASARQPSAAPEQSSRPIAAKPSTAPARSSVPSASPERAARPSASQPSRQTPAAQSKNPFPTLDPPSRRATRPIQIRDEEPAPRPAPSERAAPRIAPSAPPPARVSGEGLSDLRFVLDREPDNTPVPRPASRARQRGEEEPRKRASAPIPDADDSPTAAFEIPQEIQDWLEAERAGEAAAAPAPSEAIPSPVLELASPRGSQPSTQAMSDEFARAVDDAVAASLLAPEQAGEPTAPPAEAEAPEQVLQMLANQGIFERARSTADSTTWVPKAQAPRAGTRLGTSLAVTWVLALAAAGGGYYGWTKWLEARRADARTLIAQAVAETRDGQHVSLTAAERHLTEARKLDPKATAAAEELLFVHVTRALEDASGDLGYLRNSLTRAQDLNGSPALISAAKALLSAYDKDAAIAQAEAASALQKGAQDARVAYLVGRLYQRSGRPDARELLNQASTRDPELSLAFLAEAELARQAGELEQARALFVKALGKDGQNLRAELWTIVLDTGTVDAGQLKQKLSALGPRIEQGSPGDQLLAASARAGVARAAGDAEGAKAAVRAAAALRVLEPDLMSLFAEHAAAAGEHELAYRSANGAMLAAPSVRRYRDVLANVLLQRGDGRAVLAALDGIEESGPWLLVTRARAALLSGSREVLADAKKALASYRSTSEGRGDSDVGALLLRTDLRLGANAESLLTAARSLVHQAPDSAAAQVALGEAAVLAGQGNVAVGALEKAKQLQPGDADAHYLLGRAYRLVGKPARARESLEQALALAPSHLQARETLGGLLIDSGEYETASKLFGGLARDQAGLGAELGAVEALIGAGDLVKAEAKLGALDPTQKALPAAQVLLARLWIEKGKPGQAVQVLEPLVAEDSDARTVDVLALYGEALYAADRVDPSAGVFDDALELDPTHPDALIGRAMAAVRAEKASEAIALLERAKPALETRVRPPRVRANLLITWAKAELLQQTFDSAKQKLADALALPGVPAEAHFWYAETLARTKAAGATESYQKYLELAPNGYYAARARKALAPR